jgi:hypothetical protein
MQIFSLPGWKSQMPSGFLEDAGCSPRREDAKCFPWRGAKIPRCGAGLEAKE